MSYKDISAAEIESLLMNERNEAQSEILSRFFKTGKGQYGEGDRFLGIRVPVTRSIIKVVKRQVAFPEIEKLLQSPWHEIRLCGFLLLVEEMKANLPHKKSGDTPEKLQAREDITNFYLTHSHRANNWDLVDLSAPYIIGPYLRFNCSASPTLLLSLAESRNLWDQRIAIVSTLDLIRNNIFEPTIQLSEKLKNHPHDLIHKAIGWALREMGKRNKTLLLDFLEENFASLPRTTLRYAIERFPGNERLGWLKRT